MSVVYVYMHKHAGLGACSPRKLLEVKCSDITSCMGHSGTEAESQQLHSSQSTASNLWLSIYPFAKPADRHFLLFECV